MLLQTLVCSAKVLYSKKNVMQIFLNYLLETSCCLILFYGFYFGLLKNELSFQQNRFYLLLSACLSLIIPLLQFNIATPIVVAPPSNYLLITDLPAGELIAPNTSVFTWGNLLSSIYFIGVFIFLFRFVRNMNSIYQLQKNGNLNIADEECQLLEIDENIPAFSFGKKIFWNKNNAFSPTEQQQIIAHEKIHIQQKHSIDILFFELLQIVFWFNPIIYFFKKSIREIHEFIADQAVIQENKNAYPYAQLLLKTTRSQDAFLCITNNFNFNHSQIKRRLTMIYKTKVQEKPNQFLASPSLKYLLSIPLVMCLLLAFACSEKTVPSSYYTIFSKEMPEELKPGQFVMGCEPTSEIYMKADGTTRTKEEVQAIYAEKISKREGYTVDPEDIILVTPDAAKKLLHNGNSMEGNTSNKAAEQAAAKAIAQDAAAYNLAWGNLKNGGKYDKTLLGSNDFCQFKLTNPQGEACEILSGKITVAIKDGDLVTYPLVLNGTVPVDCIKKLQAQAQNDKTWVYVDIANVKEKGIKKPWVLYSFGFE